MVQKYSKMVPKIVKRLSGIDQNWMHFEGILAVLEAILALQKGAGPF